MKSLLFVILITLFSIPALAQDISESHLQASEELLVQMNMPEFLTESIDEIVDMQTGEGSAMAAFEDIVRSFMHENLSWNNLKDAFVQIYAEEFTEAELLEIIAFYKTEAGIKFRRSNEVDLTEEERIELTRFLETETGAKVNSLVPISYEKVAAVFDQVLNETLPELERRMKERMLELDESL